MTGHHNILLIRLGCLGDVVFTLPAVHGLRAAFPEAKFTFLVRKEFAPLLAGFRNIDAVATLDQSLYRRKNPAAMVWETLRVLNQLRHGQFSLVVDFQGFGETAMLTWLSGAPARWGSVYRPQRQWAYTRPVPRDPRLHPIEYNLAVLQQGGGLAPVPVCNEFVLPAAALDEARRFFVQHQLDSSRPTVFLQPFTSSPQKNWPLEHFVALAQGCQRRGIQVLFGGGPAEQAALEPVRQAGFAVAAGAPLLLTAGLVQLSSLVVGGDTGVLHLAVALNKRVVMAMEMVYPGSCFPYGHPDWAVAPIPGYSLATLQPKDVQWACQQALAQVKLAA